MTSKIKNLTASTVVCFVGATLMLAPAAFAQGATGSPGGAGTGGASGTAKPMTGGSNKAMKTDDKKTGPGNSGGAGTLAGTAK